MTPTEGPLDASDLAIAIAAARFNGDISERLVEGAVACIEKAGGTAAAVEWVAGSFELPLVARVLIEHHRVDAVVALGCVIRGETAHFDFVAGETARGLMTVMLETRVPIAFGVLTTETHEQALARAGGALGNKGWDAAQTAIEMATKLRRLSAQG